MTNNLEDELITANYLNIVASGRFFFHTDNLQELLMHTEVSRNFMHERTKVVTLKAKEKPGRPD